jgi:predicted Fe-Mo cluster-binding NifX family protein
MKIAISSTGPSLESAVDARFGRAKLFLIMDDANGSVQVLENRQNIDAAQGAGIQAAKLVSDFGADVVITGHCGPKAFRTLEAAGVRIILGVQGSVEEAVKRFEAGELKPAGSPDVEGHWV